MMDGDAELMAQRTDPVKGRAIRILRGCLSQLAAEIAEHECTACGSVHSTGLCGPAEAWEWAARLVDEADGIQLLTRAIWHLTPTRKLHLRVRGENIHPAYFSYGDPALFLDGTFDRFAPFGGEL